MAKFRTLMLFKEPCTFDVAGFSVTVTPGADSFGEIDVPDEQEGAVTWLSNEGKHFIRVDEVKPDDSMIITNDQGESIDLAKMNRTELVEFATKLGLEVHHKAGELKIRGQILSHLQE